ncbi:MAG TPA: UDP-N-acetylmuramoyl-L-alanyl-D-glutamate--2,6-diaminopimelate ligase [Terriglobales bacterium]|nr:UDP-N-acetylmuramoyl-L-alanyl-D-glutamate--2,6-diaminopimelate ligase [Terriglobales bacterium]
MTFRQLLDGVETLAQRGNPEITGIQYDSRRISPGDLFVAMRGETTDGNRYIEQAIAGGAAAVVSDTAETAPHAGIAWAHVPHGRQALARLAANFYGRPAVRMRLTGITGTNGKTTSAFLAEAILGAMGRTSALLGTVEYHIGPEVLPAPHTTPESLEIHRLLDRASRQGASELVMEVSSHALAQQRVFGLPFDVAVFTNLTRDHLDYHGDFEDYFEAKKFLFAGCGSEPPRLAVLNADDDYGVRLVPFAKSQGSLVVTYGIERGDFQATRINMGPQGTTFVLATPRGSASISTHLIGRVNVYNILAAAAAAVGRGCSLDAIRRGVAAVHRVPGRFESVDCGQPFAVVVDYAHTDDALRNLTAVARAFVSREGHAGRVITLFGCGGDRDRTKRPLMGDAAGRGSDFVLLTSDNPRSEDPLAIINDALVGLQKTGTRHLVEPDRRRAIERAIAEARTGDIVLIAGKGHERVQVSAAGSLPFDDVEVARETLRAAGYTLESQEAAVAGGRR